MGGSAWRFGIGGGVLLVLVAGVLLALQGLDRGYQSELELRVPVSGGLSVETPTEEEVLAAFAAQAGKPAEGIGAWVEVRAGRGEAVYEVTLRGEHAEEVRGLGDALQSAWRDLWVARMKARAELLVEEAKAKAKAETDRR